MDDSEERLRQFRQNLIGHVVECVTTAPDAIKKLKDEDWDAVFLDHDLGDKVFQESKEGTGYEVAKYLEENPSRTPMIAIVHSFNKAGADKMIAAIPRAFYVPGVWMNCEEFLKE
ncbi:MAG: response regulator [Nitrospirae bacterium]|nr:response regulator [Nitrospirota bacterium]